MILSLEKSIDEDQNRYSIAFTPSKAKHLFKKTKWGVGFLWTCFSIALDDDEMYLEKFEVEWLHTIRGSHHIFHRMMMVERDLNLCHFFSVEEKDRTLLSLKTSFLTLVVWFCLHDKTSQDSLVTVGVISHSTKANKSKCIHQLYSIWSRSYYITPHCSTVNISHGKGHDENYSMWCGWYVKQTRQLCNTIHKQSSVPFPVFFLTPFNLENISRSSTSKLLNPNNQPTNPP